MRAQMSVNTTHKISTVMSGIPPIAKCDIAPVSAVKVMINTLSADRGFQLISEHCGEDKQHHHAAACADESADKTDYRSADNGLYRTLFAGTFSIASFVVMTGRTMNFIPSRNVIMTEKLPIVADGEQAREIAADDCEREDGRHHNESVFISRFFFLPYVYAETALASTSEGERDAIRHIRIHSEEGYEHPGL